MSDINHDMIEGYMDGLRDNRDELPENDNRSELYRQGWLNGRDDRLRKPRASASKIRERTSDLIEEEKNGLATRPTSSQKGYSLQR